MAINLQLYSNANNVSKTITIDFVANIAAIPGEAVDDSTRYFLKFTTTARDTDNLTYKSRVVKGMDDLAISGPISTNQSMNGSNSAYESITAIVEDYTYDYIHGHTSNEWGSGCDKKSPMKFT